MISVLFVRQSLANIKRKNVRRWLLSMQKYWRFYNNMDFLIYNIIMATFFTIIGVTFFIYRKNQGVRNIEKEKLEARK